MNGFQQGPPRRTPEGAGANGSCQKKDSRNACYKHVSTTKHNIDWNKADILFESSDWYKRLVVESSCIVTKPNFNNMRSTLAVDKFSAQLILGTCKNISIH